MTLVSLHIEDNWTALQKASRHGNAILIHELLKNGDDPNKATAEGFTPLFLAVFSRNIDAVRAIVEGGAAINAAPHKSGNWTALHLAAKQGDVNIISLLIDNGADANAMRVPGESKPINLARAEEHAEAAALLRGAMKTQHKQR